MQFSYLCGTRQGWAIYLNDGISVKGLASFCGIVASFAVVQLLPLLFEVIHGLLLFLAGSGCVEADEVAGGIKLEYLRTKLWIDPNENQCW